MDFWPDPMLRADDPVVLLQHHGLDNLSGKTGLAMLRYRRGPILAVVDPAHGGADLRALTGIPRDVPVVASLQDALPLLPSPEEAVAVVGLAPSGGHLPAEMRADLLAALEAGMCLASGLHTRLAEDAELAARIRSGAWIWDLRQEPATLPVASAQAARLPCPRLLAVGTDMSVGKMSACLELQAAAQKRGMDARFVGTGQASILISGAQPTHLLLVHRAGQTAIRNAPHVPLPPVRELIPVVEGLASLARPDPSMPSPQVAAIALNTAHLPEEEVDAALETVRRLTGLPCHDPVRHGGDGLLKALLAAGLSG